MAGNGVFRGFGADIPGFGANPMPQRPPRPEIFTIIDRGTPQELRAYIDANRQARANAGPVGAGGNAPPDVMKARDTLFLRTNYTPLQAAVAGDKLEMVKVLLELGAQPDERGELRTPLGEIEWVGGPFHPNKEAIRKLLQRAQGSRNLAMVSAASEHPSMMTRTTKRIPELPRNVVRKIGEFVNPKKGGRARKSRRRLTLRKRQWTRRRG